MAMEQIIVDSMNGFEDIKHDKSNSTAIDKIIKFLKSNKIDSTEAYKLKKCSYEINEIWKNEFPIGERINRTPKTDIVIGKNRISLKVGDKSQLMQPQKNELITMLRLCIPDFLTSERYFYLRSLIPDILKLGRIRVLAKGVDPHDDPLIIERKKIHDKITEELSKLYEIPEFKYNLGFEGATGSKKFVDNEPKPTHILTVQYDGERNKLVLVKLKNNKSFQKMIDNSTIGFSLKSDSEKKIINKKRTKTDYRIYRSSCKIWLNNSEFIE